MRRSWALAAALVLPLSGVALLLTSGRHFAEASVLARSSGGWLAARRYLELRGTRTTLVDREIEQAPAGAVLVLAFPWQSQTDTAGVKDAVARRLRHGGTVLYAYSGRLLASGEEPVLDALGLRLESRRGRPPLAPWRWREFVAAEEVLHLEGSAGAVPRAGRLLAPRRVPVPPEGASILARDGQGRPLAFVYPSAQGQVAVTPAEAFSNARLGAEGNADLLEALRRRLGEAWAFDEFHHGLRPPASATARGSERAMLLYLWQLAFVYALVAVAVVRRFGPAWREEAPAAGSAATFLLGLGVLHDRLGHEREAARRLIERARALEIRIEPSEEPLGEAEGLLELARRVARAQARRQGGR